MPGHSLTRTTVVDAHHDHARFGWTVNGPDGTVAVAGIDVVTFAPDGRIQTAIGFFGDVADVGMAAPATRARRRGGPRSSTGERRVGGTSDACRV